MLVFLVHAPEVLGSVAGGGAWIDRVAHDLDTGRMGVVAFFAISGFVIPYSFRAASPHPILDFGIGRIFRLFPAFWVSIAPSVLVLTLFGATISRHEIVYNLTMVPRLFHAQMANGAYWTLEVELLFYAIAALMYYAQVLDNIVILTTVMLTTFLLFLSSQQVFFGGLLNPTLSGNAFYFWLHISVIFWGASLRRVWEGDRVPVGAAIMLAAYSFYWLIYFPYYGFHHGRHQLNHDLMRTVSGYSGALWLFTLTIVLRPVWTKVMNWLGRISYSFYLLHGPCIYLTAWCARRSFYSQGFRLELYCLFAFGLALCAAAASHYFVEKPGVRLGRVVARYLDGTLVPAVTRIARPTLEWSRNLGNRIRHRRSPKEQRL